ncbi:hypothetical protein Y032_0255g328 [Ancylostoma ceylanicum]|uniref:Uncharacterized protein n=1 Tax=Ancylostoma ceylanicum TaxID=53326 RepID=A0A016SC12_9BILA|nr:hypothetical protein Y032_0255g328 [Ancylostoma ceylanicum]
MVGQWPSREETYFPAGVGVNTTSSVCLFYWAYAYIRSHFAVTFTEHVRFVVNVRSDGRIWNATARP